MSTFNDIDMECPECGEEFRGTVWVAIHAGQDPELKDLMLGGELNLVSCPECGQVAFHDHFLIYQDPDEELIAYVYPEVQKREEAVLSEAMRKGFREAAEATPDSSRPSYEPILMFGLEALIDQLHREQDFAEQSDVARAICQERSWPYRTLRPSIARALDAVRVLPAVTPHGQVTRQAVLDGLRRLLGINPALDHYGDLRNRIEADPSWSLPERL